MTMRGPCNKKKGRTEVRPKFREEKPEGLAMRTGRSGLASRHESKAEFLNKWLTPEIFSGAAIFLRLPANLLLLKTFAPRLGKPCSTKTAV
jgi:hypothetical protein